MTRCGWSDLGFREVAEDTSSMCIGKGLIVSGPPQQERPPDLGSLRATRGQILAAASQRGLRDVRVFGSVARGEAIDRIRRYVQDDRARFDTDELLQSAVLHWIEIIGEAARGGSDKVRTAHPEVPWRVITTCAIG